MKNNKNIRNMKNSGGFTVIELVATIALIATLIYLAFQYLPILRDFVERKKLVDGTNAVYAVASEYAPNGDWTNATTANLLASGLLDEFHNSADTAILSPTGSAYGFAPASVGTGTNNAVAITQSDMKDRPCNLFANGYWDSSELISINAVPVKTTGNQDVQVAAINTNCSAGDNVVLITKR